MIQKDNSNSRNPKEKLDLQEKIKGTKFDELFELMDEIKSGSVGRVCKAKFKKLKTDRFAACKFLISEKSRGTREEENTIHKENEHMEILIHGKLKHKNIPNIYGYYKIKDGKCITMEFTKYGDLENFKRTILKRSSISETLICYIAGQILESLFYLHMNKIIHMDIKQQNILIDGYLNAKLTDFSVSINYKSSKKRINLPRVGTCYYISPEVLNYKTIDVKEASKIDIYSFGVLLYVLAFADYPYELVNVDHHDYDKILQNIEEKELKFKEDSGHSNMFKNFLKKCLEKNIKKRYNIYEALRDPWIKGYKIILDEKEKLYNAGKLLINLMVDGIIEYNEYIKDKKEDN